MEINEIKAVKLDVQKTDAIGKSSSGKDASVWGDGFSSTNGDSVTISSNDKKSDDKSGRTTGENETLDRANAIAMLESKIAGIVALIGKKDKPMEAGVVAEIKKDEKSLNIELTNKGSGQNGIASLDDEIRNQQSIMNDLANDLKSAVVNLGGDARTSAMNRINNEYSKHQSNISMLEGAKEEINKAYLRGKTVEELEDAKTQTETALKATLEDKDARKEAYSAGKKTIDDQVKTELEKIQEERIEWLGDPKDETNVGKYAEYKEANRSAIEKNEVPPYVSYVDPKTGKEEVYVDKMLVEKLTEYQEKCAKREFVFSQMDASTKQGLAELKTIDSQIETAEKALKQVQAELEELTNKAAVPGSGVTGEQLSAKEKLVTAAQEKVDALISDKDAKSYAVRHVRVTGSNGNVTEEDYIAICEDINNSAGVVNMYKEKYNKGVDAVYAKYEAQKKAELTRKEKDITDYEKVMETELKAYKDGTKSPARHICLTKEDAVAYGMNYAKEYLKAYYQGIDAKTLEEYIRNVEVQTTEYKYVPSKRNATGNTFYIPKYISKAGVVQIK